MTNKRRYRPETERVVQGMGAIHRPYGKATSYAKINATQKAFDNGVFAAAEFVRRLTGDESLALQIHSLVTPTQKGEVGLPIANPERNPR